uniref:Family with sequence similarity 110 member C n=2 Tax=Latimeria chalumnae TaxID=7897 RepID=H3A978_LATCH
MPTGTAHAMRMQADSDVCSSLPMRLLNKGPDYLRKQMEGENRGRMSAVERLAADKAKYVKSQQVISSKQEPVIMLSSASESSSESCSVESQKITKECTGKKDAIAIDMDMNSKNAYQTPSEKSSSIVRRSSSKRQMRPDSLVIYRQKCEFAKGQSNENSRGGLVRRLFQGSLKEKQVVSPELPKVIIKEDIRAKLVEEAPDKQMVNEEHNNKVRIHPFDNRLIPTTLPNNSQTLMKGTAGTQETKQRGLHRSQSDISSRYSKAFSEFETFFKFCGLDPEVIEDLGRENFSTASDNVSHKIRSVSVATSESGFTQLSGDNDGLMEEELNEQIPSTTSVIERNARIIKWLYSCKKAKDTNKVFRE